MINEEKLKEFLKELTSAVMFVANAHIKEREYINEKLEQVFKDSK